MRNLSWKEYYENFYNWSSSTQKSYAYRLSEFGAENEVFEVAVELSFDDEKFVSAFIRKATKAGVHFLPEHVLELAGLIEQDTFELIAKDSVPTFSREQLEEIDCLVSQETFSELTRRAHIDIYEDEDNDTTDDIALDHEVKPKIGFFTSLLAGLEVADAVESFSNRQRPVHGKCNGDCAHCPPHYGYRYGRWYYGHSHQYGCEFGGNHGDGRD